MYNVFLFIFFFNFSMISCEHSTIHEIKISAIDHFIEFLHKYMWCTYYIAYLRKQAKDKNEKKMQEISVIILYFDSINDPIKSLEYISSWLFWHSDRHQKTNTSTKTLCLTSLKIINIDTYFQLIKIKWVVKEIWLCNLYLHNWIYSLQLTSIHLCTLTSLDKIIYVLPKKSCLSFRR